MLHNEVKVINLNYQYKSIMIFHVENNEMYQIFSKGKLKGPLAFPSKVERE
jgi:hypothetical protein